MNTKIIPTPSQYEQLLHDIKELRALIVRLTALRDDLLYHICPALRAVYEKEIGSIEREILAAQMYLREKQRILEILRAQMNRQEELSVESAEQQAGSETRSYEEELKRRAREAENFRKHWENDTSWSRYGEDHFDEDEEDGGSGKKGSGSGNDSGENEDGENRGPKSEDTANDGDNFGGTQSDDSGPGKDGPDADSRKKRNIPDEIKKLYRKIVKRLHPDSNPNITEHEKELFYEAQAAFKDGDLEALQRIWDEIEGTQTPEEHFTDAPEDLEKLREILKKLRELAAGLREEIAGIRGTFPYTMKELLENKELLAAKHDELLQKLQDVRDADAQLAEVIRKLKEELNK